jgi:hypothetical protein
MLSYRIDDDDLSNWNRYSFSYLAQYEKINDNLEYCAARINLPKKEDGNLRDKRDYGDEILNFLVYVACEINYKHKYVVVRNIQLFDMENKIEYDNLNDYNSNRIFNFLKDEILVDRYCCYFLEKTIYKENSSPFDDCGGAVLVEANIMYELDSEYIVHKIVDKFIFNIVNNSRAESVDFPTDLKYVLLDEMYKLDNPGQEEELVSFVKNKKDTEFFIKNPLNLDEQSLRQSWFKEDKENYIWEYI